MLNDSILGSELDTVIDKNSMISDMFKFYKDAQNEKIKSVANNKIEEGRLGTLYNKVNNQRIFAEWDVEVEFGTD